MPEFLSSEPSSSDSLSSELSRSLPFEPSSPKFLSPKLSKSLSSESLSSESSESLLSASSLPEPLLSEPVPLESSSELASPNSILSAEVEPESSVEIKPASVSSSVLPVVFPLTATVDLDAVVRNARFFADLAPDCLLMGVVKANGYGHGMLPVARALRLMGVSWFGVSHLDEAILLRQQLSEFDDSAAACQLANIYSSVDSVIGSSIDSSTGSSTNSDTDFSTDSVADFSNDSSTDLVTASPTDSVTASVVPVLGEYVQKPRILTWLADYGQDMRAALLADLDLSVSNMHQLHAICEAAASLRAQESSLRLQASSSLDSPLRASTTSLDSPVPDSSLLDSPLRDYASAPDSSAPASPAQVPEACSHPEKGLPNFAGGLDSASTPGTFSQSKVDFALADSKLSRSETQSAYSQNTGGSCVHNSQDRSAYLPARIHLKIDVGMSRGGVQLENLPELVSQIVAAERTGLVTLESVWGHLNCADDPDGAGELVTRWQIRLFHEALVIVEDAGLRPRLRHLAATAGSLWYREAHFDLIRPGVGLYGLSPNPDSRPADTRALQPAMTLSSRLIQVKCLQPGQGVSYGATFVADRAQWVGLLPCGYGDGIARQASNRAPLWVNGYRSQILGRVCMDQIVIDLGQGEQPWGQPGDEVVLFGSATTGSVGSVENSVELEGSLENSVGDSVDKSADNSAKDSAGNSAEDTAENSLEDPMEDSPEDSLGKSFGDAGFPTADEWARAADTINYTVTTCLPAHVRRVYTGRIAKLLGLES